MTPITAALTALSSSKPSIPQPTTHLFIADLIPPKPCLHFPDLTLEIIWFYAGHWFHYMEIQFEIKWTHFGSKTDKWQEIDFKK